MMVEIEYTRRRTLHLPEEIVEEEILTRLTVKSLLRFRCVSKSWCSLIDNKRFISKHLRKSTENTSLAHRSVFFTLGGRTMASKCSLLSAFTATPDIHDIQGNIPLSWVVIVGCCNGLVCLLLKTTEDNKHLILWNPSTRISKNIAYKPVDTIKYYGFGWDESSGAYKVIVSDAKTNIYNVYSLKTDSWKKINSRGLHLKGEKRGKLAGGKLHWRGREHLTIVAFDLKKEVFEVVELPSYPEGDFWWARSLVGEYLSVSYWYEGYIDIWVMKECGGEECWEKVMTAFGDGDTPRWISPSLRTSFIGTEGEFLLIKTGTITVYDHKTNEFHDPFAMADECDVYVESLVSPLVEECQL